MKHHEYRFFAIILALIIAAPFLTSCKNGQAGENGEESKKKDKVERSESVEPEAPPGEAEDDGPDNLATDVYAKRRMEMVEEQIAARGVKDERVLEAMRKVERHKFVPVISRRFAYGDYPLPIGNDQTISQPYIVAFMTEALELKPTDKVLEIGTGSGYQAAVLAEIVDKVYSIEIVCDLAKKAAITLDQMKYEAGKVNITCADGYKGWPDPSVPPFDAIIVTAAPDHIPEPLIDQLKVGGRMVIPVGDKSQELVKITKTKEGVEKETLIPVRFVPMTGEAEKK